MTILTRSAWTYGHEVTSLNQFIPFDEGGGEINGTMNIGSYSLEDYATEIARAMNAVGGQVYTTTVNRSSRTITISATSNFDLLFSSGVTAAASIRDLAGFGTADFTATNSYEGGSASGEIFIPQFKLQDFVDFQDKVESNEASVNQSASGKVEVVTFGRTEFMECNVKYQTDNELYFNGSIENDPSGVANLRNFLDYIVGKGDIEFIPDRDTPTTFTKCILESTQSSKDGVNYQLFELYGEGLIGFFETKRLTFRKVE